MTTDGSRQRGTAAVTDRPPGSHGVRSFVRRHPYLTFLVTFNTLGQAVAFTPVVARQVYGVELPVEPLLLAATLAFLLLPALVITEVARGRDALRELVRSTFRYRVTVWWYLMPLLAVPALTVLTALPAPPGLTGGQVLTAYLTAYLPALLLQFLSTNLWEEAAWMGFFQAPLQHRFGPWRAVLLTTPFFALEHISMLSGGTIGQGVVQFGLIVLVTVPTRALMAFLYNRTGSVAMAGLVHAAANAAGLTLVPALLHSPGAGGSALLVLGLVVIVLSRGRLGFRATAPSGTSTSAPDPGERPTDPTFG